MTTLSHQIRIERPVSVVWTCLADLQAVQNYNPMVQSSKLISSKPEGIGAARRCTLKPKGWVEERVWHWDPPQAIGLEVAASEWPVVFMKWRTMLRPDGEGTVVSQSLEYRMKFGVLGALLNRLVMRRKLDENLQKVFEHLKHHLESTRT